MFGGTGGYFRLESWILANIVQPATQAFCRRFLNRQNAGKPFWGCTGYPDCKGLRRSEERRVGKEVRSRWRADP